MKISKLLITLFISAVSFTASASNFDSMIEVLQGSKTVGKIESCAYELNVEASLNIKGVENNPVYSLIISNSKDELRKAKIILVNEPTREIRQAKNGDLFLQYKISVFPVKGSSISIDSIVINANADGSVKGLEAFKVTSYLGSTPSTNDRVLSCI